VTVGVLDADFAQRLDCKIDEFAAGIDLAYLDCARKRRQVMDMVYPASLVIEKGLDLHSDSCVAQADIKQYYDNLRPLLLALWMRYCRFELGRAGIFLRLHMCPQVILNIGGEIVHLIYRCIGTLSRSRCAAAAGRIPLLDAASGR